MTEQQQLKISFGFAKADKEIAASELNTLRRKYPFAKLEEEEKAWRRADSKERAVVSEAVELLGIKGAEELLDTEIFMF